MGLLRETAHRLSHESAIDRFFLHYLFLRNSVCGVFGSKENLIKENLEKKLN